MYDIGVECEVDHLKLTCALAMEMTTDKFTMVPGNSNENIEIGTDICYCSNQMGYEMLERGRQ